MLENRRLIAPRPWRRGAGLIYIPHPANEHHDRPMNHAIAAPATQVVTAGEALMDLIEDPDGRLRPCNGGAVYNLTRALGLQGVDTLYLNPFSRDHFGQGMAHAVQAAGVSLAQALPRHEPTSLAVVALDSAGKASYSFYREGVADRQVTAADMNAACAALPNLRVVATGCLALVPQDAHHYLPWLKAQRAAGHWIAVDANLRPAIAPNMAAYQASVMAALGQAHIVKVSDDDLVTLGFDQADPLEGARALLAQTPAHWLALTMGAQGAMLLTRDGAAWHGAESQRVVVADTVGAGDCFFAGLMAALLHTALGKLAPTKSATALDEATAHALLARALASASWCVQRVGCVPPSVAEVQARMREVPVHFRTV